MDTRKKIEMTGDQLVDKILGGRGADGKRDPMMLFGSEFYHRGSANKWSQDNVRRQFNNPNHKPIPFKIPSEEYYDPYFKPKFQARIRPEMTDEEKAMELNPPTYVITSDFRLSGTLNYEASLIDFQEISSDIIIRDATFVRTVYLHYLKSNFEICFRNCHFQENVYVLLSQFQKLSFIECTSEAGIVVRNVHLSACQIQQTTARGIEIENDYSENTFPKEVIQNDFNHKIEELSFGHNEFDKINLRGGNIHLIKLEADKFTDSNIELTDSNLSIINAGESLVKLTNVKFTLKSGDENQTSTFEGLEISKLTVSGRLKKDNVCTFNSINCADLVITDFVNDGRFTFNNFSITANGRVKFDKADLAKFTLISVDFEKAASFDIQRSNITDIVTYDTVFPNTITSGSDQSLSSQRDVYRHLKNASTKQSDRVNELRYEQIEMDILRRRLNQTGHWDKWILELNFWSSRHGQDWVRAASLLGVLALIAFTIVQALLGYVKFNIGALPENIANYFWFVNPVHRFSDIYSESKPQWAYGSAKAIDILFRLISSYLIFQFYRAFRKYFR